LRDAMQVGQAGRTYKEMTTYYYRDTSAYVLLHNHVLLQDVRVCDGLVVVLLYVYRNTRMG